MAAHIFFEQFNVPAFFTSIQAVLSLYASGRTTGIVLDSGDGVTNAVPVYEGFSMPMAIRRVDVAGRDVTDALQIHLRTAGYNLHTSAEKEVVRMIKEKCCYIAMNPVKEEKELREEEEFRLPDGNYIKVRSHHLLYLLTALLITESFLCSLDQNDSDRLKSCSTQNCTGSNTLACRKSSWTQSIERTWT